MFAPRQPDAMFVFRTVRSPPTFCMEPGAPPFIRLDVRVCLPSVPCMSITQTKRLTARPVTALVPDLGLNYPNWLMGPFDLVMGCFFIRPQLSH